MKTLSTLSKCRLIPTSGHILKQKWMKSAVFKKTHLGGKRASTESCWCHLTWKVWDSSLRWNHTDHKDSSHTFWDGFGSSPRESHRHKKNFVRKKKHLSSLWIIFICIWKHLAQFKNHYVRNFVECPRGAAFVWASTTVLNTDLVLLINDQWLDVQNEHLTGF